LKTWPRHKPLPAPRRKTCSSAPASWQDLTNRWALPKKWPLETVPAVGKLLSRHCGWGGKRCSKPQLDRVCLIGPILRCREQLAAFRAAGVDLPILSPPVRVNGANLSGPFTSEGGCLRISEQTPSAVRLRGKIATTGLVASGPNSGRVYASRKSLRRRSARPSISGGQT
jgi:hypothetical protein